MKIYAPVKDFNGWRNNVRFINGVGETEELTVMDWFKTHGYKIETHSEDTIPVVEPVEPVEPDFDSMTPNELRDWMKANGLGSQIKNIRSKEKLLDIIRG